MDKLEKHFIEGIKTDDKCLDILNWYRMDILMKMINFKQCGHGMKILQWILRSNKND